MAMVVLVLLQGKFGVGTLERAFAESYKTRPNSSKVLQDFLHHRRRRRRRRSIVVEFFFFVFAKN